MTMAMTIGYTVICGVLLGAIVVLAIGGLMHAAGRVDDLNAEDREDD